MSSSEKNSGFRCFGNGDGSVFSIVDVLIDPCELAAMLTDERGLRHAQRQLKKGDPW